MALISRAAVISGWTLGSRILGLIRDRILAGAFGGSLLLDAFLLAFALPNLFRNLFGEGALSAAFVPRYVQARDQDQAEAEAFAGLVLTRLSVLLGVIAGIGMAIAGGLCVWGASDLVLVAALTLPQLPYLLFICCCAIMAGTLNGRRHFAIPAAAPVLLNIILIAAVLVWRDVWVLPYAVLITGVVQIALHLVALAMTPGGVPKVRWQSTPKLRDLRRSLLPVLAASSVFQLNALLDSVLAYALVPGAGAVAALYFANRLFQFPLALVGHGIGTAVYPELASAASRGWEASNQALRQAGSLTGAILLPASVGLFLVAEPLAGTIYLHGAFDQAALDRCSLAAAMFALGLVPVAYAKLFIRACHAHRDQRTPLRIGIATVVVNLGLNIALVLTPLQEAGLALASSISSWGSCLVYILILRRRGGGAVVPWAQLVIPVIGSVVMGAGVWALLQWWPYAGSGFSWHATRLVAAVVTGGVLYAAVAGVPLWRRLRRRRGQQVAQDNLAENEDG